MNLDELKPGYETDKLVAEAIGYPAAWIEDGQCRIGTNVTRPTTGKTIGYKHVFAPTADLNDAFWAAEQLGKSFYFLRLTTQEKWECALEPYYAVVADTPVLAICKAILISKEQPNVGKNGKKVP